MSTVKFTSTRILPAGKKGVLTPDENGYYTTVLGGLNCYNSKGEYYVLSDEVRKLFESSSIFMRRIKKGVLKSELGHPKPTPGMTEIDYYQRIMDIDEKNVCAHIAEVWLDEDFGKNHPEYNNPRLVGIIGKVAPSGPYASTVKRAFESPVENACFSVRSITEDRWENGRTVKTLKTIVSWDFVNEPGIAIATKIDSPALESYDNATDKINYTVETDYEKVLSVKKLQDIVNDKTNATVSLESKDLIVDVLKTLIKSPIIPPAYKNWK